MPELYAVVDSIEEVLSGGIVPQYPLSPEVLEGLQKAVPGVSLTPDPKTELKGLWATFAGRPQLTEIFHAGVWCDWSEPHEPYLWRLHGWGVRDGQRRASYRYDIVVRLRADEGLSAEAIQTRKSLYRVVEAEGARRSLRGLSSLAPDEPLASAAFLLLLPS